MPSELVRAKQFFMLARERYNIKLKRDRGEKSPWTMDTHLQTWRFTNVHREDDKTTVWFRDNIREPISKKLREELDYLHIHAENTGYRPNGLSIVQATLIFRWFNRISTGEIIKDLLLEKWDTEEARRRLEHVHPVVTGAYIIKAGDGVSKLDGILDCIDEALPQLPRMISKWEFLKLSKEISLEAIWEDLKTLHFMGGFMAYEVVTDLRWTPIANEANDIMTWGNLGPGAIRGLGRICSGNPEQFNNSASQQRHMLKLMQELLLMSRSPEYWPDEWPIWEMHEVEMWLCETAKYYNAIEGQRLKRRYSQNRDS